ncbi:beta-glucosidase 12 [Tanacetum coccineum]
MNGVLENGPWFIRSAPIILKKWMPNVNLLKEDLKSFPIWVKFHDIPIVAFTVDGLGVMATKLSNLIMLDSYTSSMCLQSWGCMDYACALIDIRADLELKEDMVIVIPNVEDDGDVLHMVRVEYELESPRCGVCMVFGHDEMLCLKRPVEKPKKQHTNHDGFQHSSSSHGTNVGSKFHVKPKKLIWQVVSKKNSAISSGTKKNYEMSRKVMSSTNPFDALNTIEEGNELGSNEGSIIHMIEGKLVLQDDNGKPLKLSKSTLHSSSNVVSKKVDDLVNEDNDNEVEEIYNETATYMASTSFNVNKSSKSDSGGGNKCFYEQWKESHGEDPYDDDFDDLSLTDAQMNFANAFDINLHGFITSVIHAFSTIKGLEAISNVGLPPNWGLSTINRSSFPDDFIFGSASSSFQNEGGANDDGRAPSIWDTFARKHPDKIVDHSNAITATDSYHRYKDDVKMLRNMGMDAYSFSISWSRVIPHIEPFVTLFHWDLPQALEDEYGGFLSSRVVDDFRDFAELCYRRFGDRVKNWITFNEPWSYSVGGYEKGNYAPGRCSNFIGNCTAGDSGIEPYIVAHNMLLAHAASVKLYHDTYKGPQNGRIGISLVTRWMVPYSDAKLHKDAALRALDFDFGWFLNPLTFGEYPESMRINVGNRLPRFTAEESYNLRNSLDFLGLNYYTANYVQHVSEAVTDNMTRSSDAQAYLTSERNGVAIGNKGGSEWLRSYPQGLHDLLVYIKNNYNNPPIYITENGVDEQNNSSLSLRIVLQDDFRVQYYAGHLQKLLQAINAAGVNVKGYFAWSLLDSFGWDRGYAVRFGLHFVDYGNELRRYPKFSSTWFTNFLRIRG